MRRRVVCDCFVVPAIDVYNRPRTRVVEDLHFLVNRVELDGEVDVTVADAKLGHPGVMLDSAVERVKVAVDLVLRVR